MIKAKQIMFGNAHKGERKYPTNSTPKMVDRERRIKAWLQKQKAILICGSMGSHQRQQERSPSTSNLIQKDKNHFLHKAGDPIWSGGLATYHDMPYMYKAWKGSEAPKMIAKSMIDGKQITTYELLTQSDEIRSVF
mgnify:CR=1 FL=1